MILDVNEKNLAQIKNLELRSYAGIYISIYKDFMEKIRETGIEIDNHDYADQVECKMQELEKRGANIRNDNKSVYSHNRLPKRW